MNTINKPVLLFDGVCNLCNGFVQFIIKRDAKQQFLFAALQSEAGQALLKRANLSAKDLSTVVLIDGEKAYTQADVSLVIADKLGGAWRLFGFFRIFPKGLRNIVYDWVAKNRYKWFGQQESCMIPTPELRSRFLD